jgi:hypothetical protein
MFHSEGFPGPNAFKTPITIFYNDEIMIVHPKTLGFTERQVGRLVSGIPQENADKLRPAIRAFGVKYDKWERDDSPRADALYKGAKDDLKAALQQECPAGAVSILVTLQKNYAGIEKRGIQNEKQLDAMNRKGTLFLTVGVVSLVTAGVAYLGGAPTSPLDPGQVHFCQSVASPFFRALATGSFVVGIPLSIASRVIHKMREAKIDMIPAACEVSRIAREVVREEV